MRGGFSPLNPYDMIMVSNYAIIRDILTEAYGKPIEKKT